jgi:hypothetical protein
MFSLSTTFPRTKHKASFVSENAHQHPPFPRSHNHPHMPVHPLQKPVAKRILVLGAGLVTGPGVKYMADAGFVVTVASRTVSKVSPFVLVCADVCSCRGLSDRQGVYAWGSARACANQAHLKAGNVGYEHIY